MIYFFPILRFIISFSHQAVSAFLEQYQVLFWNLMEMFPLLPIKQNASFEVMMEMLYPIRIIYLV